MVDAPVTPELAGLEARLARRRRPLLGYAMVVAAASLWGVNGTFLKVAIQSGLSPYRLAEIRSAGGAILFFAAAALARGSSLRLGRHEIPWLLAFGILGLALVQLLFYLGIERLDIGVALVLQYLSPVWVALWARFVVEEPARRRLWYGLALAFAGLTLVVELWSGVSLSGHGVATSLLGSFAYAAYILLADRSLAHGRDVLSLLAWGFAFATLFWTFTQPWSSFPAGLLSDGVSLLGRLGEVTAPFFLLVAWIVVLARRRADRGRPARARRRRSGADRASGRARLTLPGRGPQPSYGRPDCRRAKQWSDVSSWPPLAATAAAWNGRSTRSRRRSSSTAYRYVLRDLEAGGAVFVNGEEDVPDGALVVFSAHGVPPEAHVNAAARGLAVVDATTIFLIGHAGHDEIEGTLGEAPAAILRRRFPGLADEGWLEVVDVVGVTSGASAPERLVRSVCAWFAARGVGDIRPHRQVEERVTFRLPALPPAPTAAMSVSRP